MPEFDSFSVTDAMIRAWRAEDRRAHRAALRARVPESRVDEHRLDPTPSIVLEDWYSEAPLTEGESNRPMVREDKNSDVLVHPSTWATERELYVWLHRDERRHRMAWSERDEQQLVIGRLRWQVDEMARKHRTTRRTAVTRFPAARASMQQALALKARWNFQHEMYRAGVTPTVDTTRWCKQAFGRTFETALAEIRSARVRSQRQPFAAVKAGLV